MGKDENLFPRHLWKRCGKLKKFSSIGGGEGIFSTRGEGHFPQGNMVLSYYS